MRRAAAADRADVAASNRRRVLSVACLSLLLLLTACETREDPSARPDAWVSIGGQRVGVEIADTPAKQALGLGERDALPWDRGMLFPYDRPGFHAFWMKGMRFSIDIVWILDGRIVRIDANVPFEPGSNGPTLRSDSLVDAVLEVPAGYATGHGWKVGDRVITEPARATR